MSTELGAGQRRQRKPRRKRITVRRKPHSIRIALVASFVLTLTLMPVLASFFLRKPVAERDSRIIGVARRGYAPLLARTMRHPGITIVIAIAMLGGALTIGSRLGSEFLPRLEEGALTVTTTKLPGISLESAIATQTMVEKTLRKFPEVQTVVTLGGSSEIPTDPMGVEQSDTFIILKPKSEWRTAQTEAGLIEAYKQALDEGVPGITQSWAQPIEMRMDDLLQGVMADLAIVIHGTDTVTLRDLGDQVARVVSSVPGAADVQAKQTVGQPYLRVVVNRDAIARALATAPAFRLRLAIWLTSAGSQVLPRSNASRASASSRCRLTCARGRSQASRQTRNKRLQLRSICRRVIRSPGVGASRICRRAWRGCRPSCRWRSPSSSCCSI